MGRLLPLLVLVIVAAIAMASNNAESSNWMSILNIEKDSHARSMGAFAVSRHNDQNHASLQLLEVVHGAGLDRGTGHYTYKLIVSVLDGSQREFYCCEVYQDTSAPGEPPVLNLGFFQSLSEPPSPSWVQVPNVGEDHHVQSLGLFAVNRYAKQINAPLKFLLVVCAWVLDRGTEHHTYHMILNARDNYVVKYYKVEVFQDQSAPSQPPALNLGYFTAV